MKITEGQFNDGVSNDASSFSKLRTRLWNYIRKSVHFFLYHAGTVFCRGPQSIFFFSPACVSVRVLPLIQTAQPFTFCKSSLCFIFVTFQCRIPDPSSPIVSPLPALRSFPAFSLKSHSLRWKLWQLIKNAFVTLWIQRLENGMEVLKCSARGR